MKKKELKAKIERLEDEIKRLNKDIRELIHNPKSIESHVVKMGVDMSDRFEEIMWSKEPEQFNGFVRNFDHVRNIEEPEPCNIKVKEHDKPCDSHTVEIRKVSKEEMKKMFDSK